MNLDSLNKSNFISTETLELQNTRKLREKEEKNGRETGASSKARNRPTWSCVASQDPVPGTSTVDWGFHSCVYPFVRLSVRVPPSHPRR